MGTFALVVIAAAVLGVVLAIAYFAGKRRGRRKTAATYTDDPTGYVPGVWLLGGGDSAASGQRDHAHGHHGHAHTHTDHAGGHDGGSGGDAGSDGGGA